MKLGVGDGNIVTSLAVATVTNTAAALDAGLETRRLLWIENNSTVDIFIGGSTVTADTGARPGIRIRAGGAAGWSSRDTCYAISSVATTGATIGLTRFEEQ